MKKKQTLKHKIAKLISKRKESSLLAIFILSVLLLLVLVEISKRTSYKGKAYAGTIGLSISPQTGSFSQGEEFTSQIVLNNPHQRQVSAVTVTLSFDSSILEVKRLDKDNQFDIELAKKANNTTGEINLSLGKLEGSISDSLITLGTVTFSGKQAGTSSVSFGPKVEIVTEGAVGDVHLEPTPKQEASYTITSAAISPTPTPSPIVTISPTTTPSRTPTPTAASPTATYTPTPSRTPTPGPDATACEQQGYFCEIYQECLGTKDDSLGCGEAYGSAYTCCK